MKAENAESSSLWTKAPVANLVRYEPSGIYFARAKVRGKLVRKTLDTNILSVANPKLKGTFFLPETFIEGGKLSFKGYRGKKTWLLIRGRVTFQRAGGIREVNYHHFAFRLRLARGLDKSFYVQLAPSLVFFDEKGVPITDKSAGSRRRRMTKMWFNNKWLTRLMAAEQLLTSHPGSIPGGSTIFLRCFPSNSEPQI
jgi:hypothetical protein